MPQRKLSDLCRIFAENRLPAELRGDDRLVHAVNTLELAGEGEITFISNPKYLALAGSTRAAAVIAHPAIDLPNGLPSIRVTDPYAAMTVAIIVLHGHRSHPQWGISDRATIAPTARLGARSNIAPGVTIGAGAVLGENCTLYPGCYIADGVRIGDDCIFYPNVVVYDHCVVGNRVTIHAGSVIGQDGLGYAPRDEKWIKIPQVGRTIIADDVEIGANCAIDRATLGQTEVGAGTKFGNVVVIGHGTKIGPDCLFVGQIGVAGSATIGRHVTLAGQVGVGGHITIGDKARVGAQAGVHGDVEEGANLLGSPAVPIEAARRSLLAMQKLPDWIKRVRALEGEVKELRERLNGHGETE